LFWAGVVGGFALALWPETNPGEPWFAQADKVEHALCFAALAIVGLRAGYRSMIRLAIGLLSLGAAVEIAQGLFTTTRSAEWLDWFADGAGIALGLAIWRAAARSSGLEQEHGR
jgi:VanZ family protein